ncbi:MAG: hypothetical protein RR064_00170 [Oscillospiraceae bacterium]
MLVCAGIKMLLWEMLCDNARILLVVDFKILQCTAKRPRKWLLSAKIEDVF